MKNIFEFLLQIGSNVWFVIALPVSNDPIIYNVIVGGRPFGNITKQEANWVGERESDAEAVRYMGNHIDSLNKSAV